MSIKTFLVFLLYVLD